MYTTLPTFVLGFHGCDQTVANRVVRDQEGLHSLISTATEILVKKYPHCCAKL